MADSKTLPIKRFASSAAWDVWLQKHHTRSPGVWLEFAKKGRQSPPLSHAQALETALCYGWIDGQTASSNAGWWRLSTAVWNCTKTAGKITHFAGGTSLGRPGLLAARPALGRGGGWG